MEGSNPYADFGTVVTGERFIGRESELDSINKRIFGDSGFGSMAVVGLPQIGKTSLVSEAMRRAEESDLVKFVAVQASVGNFDSFDALLKDLIKNLIAEVERREFSDELIKKRAGRVLEEHETDRILDLAGVLPVFESLQRAGVRPVCILDGFDAGRRLFREKPQYFNWLRELCSEQAAVILVAKRRLQDISRLAGYDSNYWSNVIIELPLKPLSDDETGEFFSRLTKKLKEKGIEFGKTEQGEVQALCGGHPYLLDAFGYYAWNYAEQVEKIGVEWIVEKCGELVHEYVDQVETILVETILRDGPINKDALRKLGVELPKGKLRGFWQAIEEIIRQKSDQTNLRTKNQDNTEFDIGEVIEKGESETVEFKSTLRINLHTKKQDKKMELAVLKTLAGFLNTEGGTLIVGVSDDGQPTEVGGKQVGIKADKFPSEDKMRLHLTNLVRDRMGGAQVPLGIRISYEDYRNNRVMALCCSRSPYPVYVEDDKNNRFYIRSDASTQELKINEIYSYIDRRFD